MVSILERAQFNYLRLRRAIKGRSEDYRNKNVNSPLKNLKWNALGDSITNGELGELNYRSIVAKEEGMLVRNYGIHASRISRGNNPSGIDTAMSERYAAMDNDADIITVFGGINDIKSKTPLGVFTDKENTTFYGSLHMLLSGLKNKYNGKKIGFITPLNYGKEKPLDYIEAVKVVCKSYDIPVLDLYNNWLTITDENMAEICPDRLHPNSEGHKLLAIEIKKFLLTLKASA